MDRRSLDELTEAAARGDRAAVDELLVRHLPDLRAYIRLRAGGALRARERESDLVQSVVREVIEHAGRFRHGGEGAFRNWLFTTAMRKLVNRNAFHRAERRDAARVDAVASPDQLGELGTAYARFATPSRAACSAEEIARIERAFAALPDDYREVILLSRVVGLDRAGVAAQMGRTESSIRNLLHRALAKLGSDLAVEG